ncbi:MAG TPA: hypothetical protein VFZ42_16220 [Chitinophagaceae bacterium]
MRTTLLFIIVFFISFGVSAQEERDTVLSRCPIYIIDTVTSNNFFLEYQPSVVKVTRARGKLTIVVQQKDQFFTLFFRDKHLENNKYKIVVTDPSRNEVEAKYSFRSGGSASYVSVSKGMVESNFDKEKDLWHIKVNGLLSNMAANTVSYYKVRADFFVH